MRVLFYDWIFLTEGKKENNENIFHPEQECENVYCKAVYFCLYLFSNKNRNHLTNVS